MEIGDPDYNLYAYEPTLSELIKECGKNICNLQQIINGWQADECEEESPMYKMGNRIETYGNNPEEAVAKLWLKLNNK